MRFEPVAIVGRGCVLPGADKPSDLWKVIEQDQSCLRRASQEDWRADPDRILANAPEPGHAWSAMGGFPSAVSHSKLDPSLDPVFHLVAEAVDQALQESGKLDSDLLSRTGLIMGNLSYPIPALLDLSLVGLAGEKAARELDPDINTNPANLRMSAGPVLATAKAFGLGKECFALDAACASSLYAIKLACDRLHDRTADFMLAGGVNGSDFLCLHTGFTALGALSPSGQSRPFHKDADGLIPSHGSAVVGMRRLEDAQNDGDPILGIIRGIGLSNDGRAGSFLTPSDAAQVRAMTSAFDIAGVDPGEVSYVECHATGTEVGDATELRAIAQVWQDRSLPALGSLKANIGHTVTASGAAGLLKLLGIFEHKTIPPTPNQDQPNEEFARNEFPELETSVAWEGKFAAVSSFGFGGNNAHLVLQSPDASLIFDPNAAKGVAQLERIAVVGIGARTHLSRDFQGFAQLLNGIQESSPIREIDLHEDEISVPPSELQAALPQQLFALKSASEAMRGLHIPQERTGVYAGMQCDPLSSRYVLRARIADLNGGSSALEDLLSPPCKSGNVIGCMPNITANRINHLRNLQGASFSVSEEELSGDRSLELAIRALRKGEIDCAIVSAVDMCREELQEQLSSHPSADASASVVLKSETRARIDGDAIFAWIEADPPKNPDVTLDQGDENDIVAKRIGNSHSASGLLRLVAGIAMTREKFKVHFETEKLEPLVPEAIEERSLMVSSERDGRRVDWSLTIPRSGLFENSKTPTLSIERYAATSREELADKFTRASEGNCDGPHRLAIVSASNLTADERAKIADDLVHERMLSGRWNGTTLYREAPIEGELGFVFTGASAARAGVAAEILRLFPALFDRIDERVGPIWKCGSGSLALAEQNPFNSFSELKSSSFVCQLDAELSRHVLGLNPDAYIGLSSGETNSLVASGVWRDMCALLNDVDASGLYQVHLEGDYKSVRNYWQLQNGGPISWENWLIRASADEVEHALGNEDRVFLTIVQAPESVLIGGDGSHCRELLERLGSNRAVQLRSHLCCHCAPVEPFAAEWKRVHTREVHSSYDRARIYSNHLGRCYEALELTPEKIAEAITGQAKNAIDYPTTIQRAWDDGVRVFLEHSPDNRLSQAIGEILGDREHLAVALHDPSRNTLDQLARAAASLWTAGIEVAWEGLSRANSLVSEASLDPENSMVKIPATWPSSSFSLADEDAECEPMPTKPDLLEPVSLFSADRAIASETLPSLAAGNGRRKSNLHPVAQLHRMATEQHMEYLRLQQAGFQNLHRINSLIASQVSSIPPNSDPLPAPELALPSEEREPEPLPKNLEEQMRAELRRAQPAPTALWEWDEMLKLSSGKISEVFGPEFESQDSYEIQVRLPCPPLLLCERVLAIDAEPRSMETGTIWTEHTVTEDKWYLHQRRMPPGVFIECGQADLTLISYLGADFLNKGERVYRLLGCELTWLGPLPEVGETLKYEIRVRGHAKQGDVRLFFFEYECWINGQIRAQVRSGQAGFFTEGELADSGGVVWEPAAEEFTENPRLASCPLPSQKERFTSEEIEAYLDGDLCSCFGPDFAIAKTQHRTPRTEKGKLNFLEEIVAFDPNGGPAGRGYVKAVQRIHPNDWFFDGHFHKDPCMPGTLMANGCQQLLSFFLVATGFTLERDGWRFETPENHTMKFLCRGQVVPESRELTYEVFVDEIVEDGEVTLIAHVLCVVDGLKAFFADRMAVSLVPAWPADSLPEAVWKTEDRRPVAMIEEFPLDYSSLMNCALGKPSQAFGPAYARYDGSIPPPRLPNPPYHFATRIVHLEGNMGAAEPGAEMEMLYDIPADAWYFRDDPGEVMPFCVLMEVALQPCGWLSSYNLNDSELPSRLLYRNLDGTSEILRAVTASDRTLRTQSKLLSHSQSGDLIIDKFEVRCLVGEETVMTMKTTFGFFPPHSFVDQKGLAPSDRDREILARPSNRMVEFGECPTEWFRPVGISLPGPQLLMLDRITGCWEEDGATVLRAEKDVDPADWYFKAHFYTDPVQPGSLGVEAILQLIQAHILDGDLVKNAEAARFEPCLTDRETEWHYRGQVVPKDDKVIFLVRITDTRILPDGIAVEAEGQLWVNNLKIYHVPKIGMRVVEGSIEPS